MDIETNIVKEKNIHFPDLVDVDNNLSISDQKSIFKDKTIIGKKFEIVCWDTGSFFTPNYSIDVLESNGILDYKLEVKSNEFYVNLT